MNYICKLNCLLKQTFLGMIGKPMDMVRICTFYWATTFCVRCWCAENTLSFCFSFWSTLYSPFLISRRPTCALNTESLSNFTSIIIYFTQYFTRLSMQILYSDFSKQHFSICCYFYWQSITEFCLFLCGSVPSD